MLFSILLGFVCFAVVALSSGLALVRILKLDFSRLEAAAFAYLLGSAAASTVIFALACMGWSGPELYLGAAVVSLGALAVQRKWFLSLRPAPADGTPMIMRVVLGVMVVFYGAIYIRQALAPEMSPDGMAYHLGLVNLWVHEGGIHRIASMYAAMPEGVEMLFLFAFQLGRHSAAALVHLSFLFDLGILMLLYGRRFGWNPTASAFAAILVFASPLFGTDATVAYVDVALAAVAFGAVYLLEVWNRNRDSRTLFACGLLVGFAMAIKYSAVPLFFVIAVIVVWREASRNRQTAVRSLLLLTSASAILIGPYLLRNWIWFQNPLSPFANALFPNQWFHVSLERAYTAQMASNNGATWLDMGLGLTMGNSHLPNSYGTLFLLLPLALVGLVSRQARTLVIAALVMGVAFLTDKDPRFLVAAVPPAAMALAFVLGSNRYSRALIPVLAVAHMVISWPAFMDGVPFPAAWQWRLHSISWKSVIDPALRAETLGHDDEYRMARNIERLVPEGEPVLAFTGGAAQSWTSRRIVVCWQSAYGERMADLLFSKWNSPADRRRRFTFAVPPGEVSGLRVVQDGADDKLMWNVDEIAFRSGGRVLPVSRNWLLEGYPNPRDLAAAFDGDLATRWRSWSPLRPGMYIDVQFPAGEKPDQVEVVLDNREWTTLGEGVWAARVSLEVATTDGRRTRIAPEISEIAPVDLRKAATAALKANGIRYVLITAGDWQQHALRDAPELWNMRAIAETANATLFRIE